MSTGPVDGDVVKLSQVSSVERLGAVDLRRPPRNTLLCVQRMR